MNVCDRAEGGRRDLYFLADVDALGQRLRDEGADLLLAAVPAHGVCVCARARVRVCVCVRACVRAQVCAEQLSGCMRRVAPVRPQPSSEFGFVLASA